MGSPHEILTQTTGFNVSDSYNVIPTQDVIVEFERFGFELQDLSLARIIREEKENKQKHLVRMSQGEKLFGEMRVDVIIQNSYDRSTALNIRIGMFRFACANGLIIGSNLMPTFRVVHSNNSWMDQIHAFIDSYEEKYKIQKAWIDNMMASTLTYDTIEELAFKAIDLRHYDKRIKNDPIDPMEINIAKRPEDRSRNAWATYNRFQENLINGYYTKVAEDGSYKKAKVLTNTDELVRVNVELADLFAEAVA